MTCKFEFPKSYATSNNKKNCFFILFSFAVPITTHNLWKNLATQSENLFFFQTHNASSLVLSMLAYAFEIYRLLVLLTASEYGTTKITILK